jgi:predicted DNA binding CopG/RHH family protein
MMKKITKITSALLALGMGGMMLVACAPDGDKSGDGQQKVMNISLNPQVEFVLDKDDKVITVNALNEEGNLIISAKAFENVEGKSAEEAAKLFVEVSAETGYLVSGTLSAGDNQLSISLSGDTEAAKELYDDVKAKMNEYLDSVDVTAKINQAAAITEAKVKELLAECAPYLETAEMKYDELVKELAKQRKETAEFYSQELKNAYYEAKEFAMEQAELETLKSKLDSITQIAFDLTAKVYTALVEGIEKTRMTLLVNEDSLYQKALAAFREVKAEYLKARNEFSIGDTTVAVEITETELAAIKARVEQAETALLNAGVKANETLDQAKAQIKTAYGEVIAWLEEKSVTASAYLDEISVKQKEKQEAFFTEFETNYAAAKRAAENNWKNMQEALEGSEEAAE